MTYCYYCIGGSINYVPAKIRYMHVSAHTESIGIDSMSGHPKAWFYIYH